MATDYSTFLKCDLSQRLQLIFALFHSVRVYLPFCRKRKRNAYIGSRATYELGWFSVCFQLFCFRLLVKIVIWVFTGYRNGNLYCVSCQNSSW